MADRKRKRLPRRTGAGNEKRIAVVNSGGVKMLVAPDSGAAPNIPPKKEND